MFLNLDKNYEFKTDLIYNGDTSTENSFKYSVNANVNCFTVNALANLNSTLNKYIKVENGDIVEIQAIMQSVSGDYPSLTFKTFDNDETNEVIECTTQLAGGHTTTLNRNVWKKVKIETAIEYPYGRNIGKIEIGIPYEKAGNFIVKDIKVKITKRNNRFNNNTLAFTIKHDGANWSVNTDNNDLDSINKYTIAKYSSCIEISLTDVKSLLLKKTYLPCVITPTLDFSSVYKYNAVVRTCQRDKLQISFYDFAGVSVNPLNIADKLAYNIIISG